MVWRPLTLHSFGTLLADQDRELEPALKSRLSPFRCNPSTVPCVRAGRPDRDSMWVVARAGERVLLYDSVEEEFGTGVVDGDGVLRDWGTSGHKLKWSVARFLADQPAQAAGGREVGGRLESYFARRSSAGALDGSNIRDGEKTGMSSETLHLQAPQPEDEVAVRVLYTQLMDGWNKGSGEAFSAPFTEDGHLVAFDGMHFKGRDEIVSFHRPLFDKWLRGTRLVGKVESVCFLSPHVALMHARGGTIMRGESRPSPERDSIQTLVAVKRGGEWRLVAFQNTRVRPMSRNARNSFIWLFTDWLWKVVGSTK